MSQQDELSRVTKKISPTVLKFVAQRWVRGGQNRTFFASELAEFVELETKTAPASPDRILRALRQDGYFDYDVARTNSEYTLLTGVFDPPKPEAMRPRKKSRVRVRVWMLYGSVIDYGPYFTEEDANRQNTFMCSGWGTVKEEIRWVSRA